MKIKEINKFKINDSENGVMTSDVLQINGSSYCEGMPDYDWFFSIASKDFPNLLNALTGLPESHDNAPNKLVVFLQENGTTVSELRDICENRSIEHSFMNYM